MEQSPDPESEPGAEPTAEPGVQPVPRRTLGPHLVWACAATTVLVLLAAGLLSWLSLRGTTELLRPRVVEQLQTSLSGMAGRQMSFLVAYQFSTRTSAEATKSYFLGDLSVGSSDVQASWQYSVDFGIDLDELGDFAASLTCDELRGSCTWTVPPPRYRPPAIDTSSIRLSSRGSLLVTDSLEASHRDEVMRQLSVLTHRELRRPEFQQLVRENVRVALERLAANLVAGSETGPVSFDLLFEDDAAAPEQRSIRSIPIRPTPPIGPDLDEESPGPPGAP